MKHQFRLVYPVCDSDRLTILNLDGTEMLFDSVDDALAFREANDFSLVNSDAYYWLTDKPNDKPDLSCCYIELAE